MCRNEVSEEMNLETSAREEKKADALEKSYTTLVRERERKKRGEGEY